MKPTIEELMLQIISTALLINQQGVWTTFFYGNSHFRTLDVTLLPAGQIFGQQDPARRHTKGAYWNHPTGWGGQTDEQNEQQCHEEMTALLAWLQGYLDTPATTAQEAAA
ncbi:hypothetical protein P2Q70_18670 [Pseudomonas mendocina]|uniref:hypothetical protein n=1 Tax=Ectopseudomonas mendocina TaxID=300 RepID=UPI0023DC8A81|nr:hypothetical protein [Pseudomonas mendocina]MDF2076613.1 hypothetical protein [Pseudomonas mendocina]